MEAEVVAMLSLALDTTTTGIQVCLYYLALFASIWDMKLEDDQDLLRLRFQEIIRLMSSSMDLLVPILHYSTRTFFKDYAYSLWTRHDIDVKRTLKFEPKEPELVDVLAKLGQVLPDNKVTKNFLSFQQIFEPVQGIVLANIFLLELEMYLHYFKLPDQNKGFLPVYYSLAQQFMRQEPQTHLRHATIVGYVPSISFPTPLQFRTPGYPSQGIQFFGIQKSTDRLPHDNLLVAQGDLVKVEYYTPSELALLKQLTKENIQTSFVALQDQGVTHYKNETLRPFHKEFQTPRFKLLEVNPGIMVVTQDQRFVNYLEAISSNQLILSSGFVSINLETQILTNRVTLAKARGWQLDIEIPSTPLYKGLWASEAQGDFLIQVPLTGLGKLSDVLVGQGLWQKGGTDAFALFQADKDNLRCWQERTVVTVYAHQLKIVDQEKRLFGANLFFVQEGSEEKLAALGLESQGKGKEKAQAYIGL